MFRKWRHGLATRAFGFGAILTLSVLAAALGLLLYIAFAPFVKHTREAKGHLHEQAPELIIEGARIYTHIAITVDFSANDRRTISTAVARGDEKKYPLPADHRGIGHGALPRSQKR